LERDRLARNVLSNRERHDRLWLANGDELAGHLLPAPAEHEAPPLFGVASLRIALEAAEKPLTIGVENVVAAALAHPPGGAVETQPGHVQIGFRDGSCLPVAQVAEKSDRVELTLTSGDALVAEASRFWDEVTLLQPCGPHVTYLSDLEPLQYKHVPFLDLSWPDYGRDRNVVGGLLRSGGRVSLKGLGMHSTSRVVFDLAEGVHTFGAELAVDDSAGGEGSVTFRVFLESRAERDAAGRWEMAYESPIIRGGQPPRPLALDVTGASRMALVVDSADRGDVLDRANWLNARLVARKSLAE
jgi:hypothetical protein